MITAKLRITVAAHNRQALVDILRFVMDSIRGQSHCLGCHLALDLDHEDDILYEEVWRSQKDLAWHLGSERYRYILEAMELGSQPPEIVFLSETPIGGMELIQAVRGNTGGIQ
jgi:quinol monooxygenase YgiN